MEQLIKGFKDILPGETEVWRFIEKTAADLFENFGFKEIRLPILEKTTLFARSIGEQTDIVEKEMYTFADRGGDLITMRPEATASTVRSYLQHKMYAVDPVRKFYTIGPMFRRERPQKGRYRQFYQINAEIFGVASPLADVQLVHYLVTFFNRLGLDDLEIHVNSLGCPECRPGYKKKLMAYIGERQENLCADCKRRFNKNPLRVLDCKVPACQDAMAAAPGILDHLCGECRRHFDELKSSLGRLGIPFVIDKRLVRGLDYYTRTIFEIHTTLLGAQSAVAGGGRYDGLAEMLGGPAIPATGFAVGFDRLAELAARTIDDLVLRPHVFIAVLGEKSRPMAFDWMSALNLAGVRTEMDLGSKSLKSQMKRADRLGAGYVLIVGDNEIEKGSGILRNMTSKDQVEVPFGNLIQDLVARIL